MNIKLVLVLIFFGCFVRFEAVGQGIEFLKIQNVSYQEVLKLAKEEKKLIFIDVYTTWCGPCKLMDKTTFSDPDVGKKFNNEFISFKVNGEDVEGRKLVEMFKINAYPTFLFVDETGSSVNRLEGVFPPKLLIEEADYTTKLWLESK
jgi:thiol:disulfide interchange protein